MKVSLITATSNSEKTIKDCMQSLLSQVYKNIEFIIIDNVSTDLTKDLVNSFKLKNKRIKLISEKDKGIYDALNKGLEYANGDIIGFLHSDDIYHDCFTISNIVNVFRENKTDGVFGDLQYVNKHDTKKIVRLWKSRDFNVNLISQGWMPAHPTLFLKKEVYKKHGKFNLNYKISADYDFMLRILKDDSLRFIYLQKVITKMRLGGISNRSLKNIIQKIKEDYLVVRSNNVGGWFVIFLKNFSKLRQFIIKS